MGDVRFILEELPQGGSDFAAHPLVTRISPHSRSSLANSRRRIFAEQVLTPWPRFMDVENQNMRQRNELLSTILLSISTTGRSNPSLTTRYRSWGSLCLAWVLKASIHSHVVRARSVSTTNARRCCKPSEYS